VSCNLNKAGHRRRSTARVSKAGIYRASAWLAWLTSRCPAMAERLGAVRGAVNGAELKAVG
jgi:hypothetical protein